jgi:hypothetical protein
MEAMKRERDRALGAFVVFVIIVMTFTFIAYLNNQNVPKKQQILLSVAMGEKDEELQVEFRETFVAEIQSKIEEIVKPIWIVSDQEKYKTFINKKMLWFLIKKFGNKKSFIIRKQKEEMVISFFDEKLKYIEIELFLSFEKKEKVKKDWYTVKHFIFIE